MTLSSEYLNKESPTNRDIHQMCMIKDASTNRLFNFDVPPVLSSTDILVATVSVGIEDSGSLSENPRSPPIGLFTDRTNVQNSLSGSNLVGPLQEIMYDTFVFHLTDVLFICAHIFILAIIGTYCHL